MTPVSGKTESSSNISNMLEPCGDSMTSQTDGDILGLSDLFSRLSLSDSSNKFSICTKSSFTDKRHNTPNKKSSFFNYDSFIDKNSNFADNDVVTDKSSKFAENNGSCIDKKNSSTDNNCGFIDQKGFSASNLAVNLNNDNKACMAIGDTGLEQKAEIVAKKDSIKYYAVALPVGMESSEEGSLIYTDLKDALKAIKTYKGARFKEFSNKGDALKYAVEHLEKFEKKKSSEDEHLKHRTSQELCKIRKMIERGDEVGFAREIWMYPRTLVAEVDIPTVMQHGVRFNALHVAAKCDKPLICQLILDVLENPHFAESLYPDESPSMRFRRMYQIRDLYLNTGTQKTGDTPLHYAAKFGCIDCCKVLLSHPQCDIDKRNVDGFTAQETICSRLSSVPSNLKEEMEAVFEEGLVYVPVLKSNNDVSPSIVGKPCSCKDIDRCASLLTDDDPKLSLKAFAGPMSPKMAQQFYKALKNPSSPKYSPFTPEEQGEIFKIRRTDPEKGVERIGRHLAEDMKVDWQEYFPDFNVFANFATKEGLDILEARMKKLRHGEPFSIFAAEEPAEQSIALVHQFPSHVNPLKHRVNVLYSLSEKAKKDEDFNTPPSSPEFITPPTSPCGSPERELKKPVFLNGSCFSKLDIEIYQAIQDYDFNPDEYPNVSKWKLLVSIEMKNHSSVKHQLSQHKDFPSHKSRIFGKEFKPSTRKKLF
ncbi:Ankyrin repeat and LEM domain-containing protein 2 [Araneus ventricosus]|uniref:Ankyrin repeat and LEM domain-containing protein 2 n=1 Tax=Araneus ventricosus TaxID=182803 RepID=A0A4Y2QTH5_ARAVE|nr:Ankyrin repeat and LEM domain-containing protein 2 [Araneus ventricosus]